MADTNAEICDIKPNPPNSETKLVKSGWLSKRSKVAHNWERKFFTLNENNLYYSDSSDSDEVNIALKITITVLKSYYTTQLQ